MLQQCAVRFPPRTLPSQLNLQSNLRVLFYRWSSSKSDRTRRFSQPAGLSKLKPWQKVFLVGTAGVFIAGQIVFSYNRYQASNSFVKYKLVAKDPVSSTASVFYLEPSVTSKDIKTYQNAYREGIWNVQFKQPQIQIVRAYTPLPPPVQDQVNGKSRQLRFLIRHDPHGEVSSYLHRLPIGSDIEMRGPNIEYQLTADIQQVVFFAGGTGIAPALQIASAMFDAHQDDEENSGEIKKRRKLHILWANRRREDCRGGISDAPPSEPAPPKATWSGLFAKQKERPAVTIGEDKGLIVQELEDLKMRYPGQITVEYFVNTEGTWIDEDAVLRSLSRFEDKDFSAGRPTSEQQRQILISGPSGFISYLAGPKEWRHGKEEQGPVSKIVAHAIAQNPHHVKVWKV